MKKFLFFVFALFISSLSLSAQVKFESGYFINQNDQRINCLIKNLDLSSNPTEFTYKLSEDGKTEIATIETVKEFEITGISKFIRQKVDYEVSSDELHLLIENRNPIFEKKTLFLRVLVQGKASLYSYQDRNVVRLFYQMENELIEPLVYKRYLIKDKIAKNNYYKQQIYKSLTCETITLKEVERLNYYINDITKLFVKYNICADKDFVYQEKDVQKSDFNLAIRPGINASSFTFENATEYRRESDMGSQQNFRLGIEAELVFPFSNNKWALIFEPTYQYYKANNTFTSVNTPGGLLLSDLEFNSIELPIGFRHYFYINDNTKIFLNMSYVVDVTYSSNLNIRRPDNVENYNFEINSSNSIAFGGGIKYKKFSLEARYFTGRNLLTQYKSFDSSYKTLSFILGYQLF